MRRALLIALVAVGLAHGTTYYWVGGDGSWQDAANWTLVDDGTGGGDGVPGVGDDARVTGNRSTAGTITLNADVTINSFGESGGGGVDIDLNDYNLTCEAGEYTQYSGATLGGSGTLTCECHIDNNGSFQGETGTVVLTGDCRTRIESGTGGTDYYNLVINSSGTLTLGLDDADDSVLTIRGDLTVQSGTFTTYDSNYGRSNHLDIEGSVSIASGASLVANASTINVAGDFTVPNEVDRFQRGTSHVVLDGTGTVSNPRYESRFDRVTVAASGQTTTMATDFRCRILELGAGTFAMNGMSIITGDGAADGDTIIKADANAAVTTNAGNPHISLGSGGGTTYYVEGADYRPAEFSNAGGPTYVFVTRPFYATRLDQVGNSTFDFNGQDITIDGQWNIGYDGSSPVAYCRSGTVQIHNLYMEGPGGAVLNLESSTFRIYDDIAIDVGTHTINAGTSTVRFIGSSGTDDITLRGNALNDVIFDASGNSYVLHDSLECADLTFLGGTLNTSDGTDYNIRCTSLDIQGGNLTANASTITVSGDISIANTNGLFSKGTSTVILAASGNIANRNWENRFHDLTQLNGVTTSLTDNTYVGHNFTSGDGTSSVVAAGGNRELKIQKTGGPGRLINNGCVWGGNGNTLSIHEGSTYDFPAGDYGDCNVESWSRVDRGIAGDIVTTGQVSQFPDYQNSRPTLDLSGHDLTCGALRMGSYNGVSRGRILVDTNSTLTVTGDVTFLTTTETAKPQIAVDPGSSPTINIGGSITCLAPGNLDLQNATVVFNGTSGTQTVTSAGASFANVSAPFSGATWTLADNLNCTGDLTVTNGTPSSLGDMSGITITVAGDASFAGSGSGSLLNMNPASGWTIDAGVSLSADFVSLANNTASNVGGVATSDCINGGGNVNWSFGDAPPTITQQPLPDTINEGEDATFSVSAFGNPSPSYQWRHDGADVPGATGSSYTVSSATLADSGNYSVMVYNTQDTVYSNVVKLTVEEVCTAVSITDTLQDQSVTSGSDVTLSVTATGSRLEYQWYYGGVAQTGATSSTLVLSSIGAGEAGDYFVRVYNSCSADTSRTATISVCEPPTVTVEPANQDVIADNSAIFSVTATGTDRQYQWYRDTAGTWEAVSGATNTQYSLLAPLSFDSALFRVRVYNSCGEDYSAACTLFVSQACVAPTVDVDPVDTTVTERSAATLRVSASGTDLTYQWLRGATPITAGATNPFTFTPQRWHDGQQYRCVVTGQCGVDTSGAMTLSVTDTTRPNPTTSLTLNAVGAHDINVKWTTPESDSTDIDSVFVYYSATAYQHHSSGSKVVAAAQPAQPAGDPAGEQSLDLSGLDAQQRYYFTVWLRDTVGNWAAADSDTVSTIAEGVPTNPVVLRGEYVDDTHVRLTLSNFCQLASGNDPFRLWGEYVGVWYQAGAFVLAPDTASTEKLVLPLASIQTAAGCPSATFDTLVTLPTLSGADSLYFFSVSVQWHNPDSLMPFTLSNGDSVLMRDITPPVNALSISGSYPGGRSDSAVISLGNTNSLEPKVGEVTVACSFDSLFEDTISVRTLSPDTVGSADPYTFVIRNSAFDGSIQTVYCAVVLTSDQGVASSVVRASFQVGRDIPQNPIVLNALPLSSFEIALSWPAIGGTGADSIRILRDTVEIPLNVVDVTTAFAPVYLGGLAVGDTINGLNASTVYHFAAQAHISGEWTSVTAASRAFAATFEADPSDTITNTVTIDAAWFDTSTNRIYVAWNYAYRDSISYGITYGVDSGAAADQLPGAWDSATSAIDTSYIQLGEDILFDTTYYVFVRLRKAGGSPSSVTENATWAVRMPAYTWEPIAYFRSTTGDTVRAFNSDVALWYDGSWGFGLFRDTVRAFLPDVAPDGMVPVSTGFTLSRYDDGPALTLALRYDSIPSGYAADDIRVYRYTLDGRLLVYHDFVLHADQGYVSIDSRLVSLVNEPLILMVDTERPTSVVLSDIDAPVPAGVQLIDSVQVSDNVSNLVVTLLYSRAENAPRPMVYDTLQSQSMTITTDVPSGYVTDDGGVRIYLVVSDGTHADTVNLSRQVIRTEASDIATEALKWVPLRTTAVLDDNTMGSVVEGLLGGPGYDNTVCRVFRWFDPSSTDGVSRGAHSWVEYSEAAERLFRIQPGRLMWIKTKDSRRPSFGRGVTVSLRENQTIELAPGNWTDVALPYKFSVCLGDILDATGAMADSLQYYSWVNGGDGVYTTQTMYIATLTDSAYRDPSTQLNAGIRDGYSIYNPTQSPVSLVVPPISNAMSDYRVVNRVLPKAAVSAESWSLRVTPRVGDSRSLGVLVLGYDPSVSAADPTWYPASPSFSDVQVRVVDKSSGTQYGHVVGHTMVGGGIDFELAFTNAGDSPRTVVCELSGLAGLPDSLHTVVVDPSNGGVQPEPAAIAVEVPAKSTVQRTVSVGQAGYHLGALADVRPFARFLAYPNPFRGAVAISFMLPDNVGRVEYELFDAMGRQVWRLVQRDGLRVGANQVVWDGCVSRGRAAAAGMYLLRATAYGRDGARMASREQRLVHAR